MLFLLIISNWYLGFKDCLIAILLEISTLLITLLIEKRTFFKGSIYTNITSFH
uniref:Uncharacterized protein n=1 Tax=Staphylococcus aureus TaxID=1280 RepID=A0A0C6EGI5_STAAU|nr:phage protein [Staphylococcus aureus]